MDTMLKWIQYQFCRLQSNLDYFDILVLMVVTYLADWQFALVGLFFVFMIQLFQFYASIDFKWLKPKNEYYSGSRKMIMKFLSMFCTAVGFKMIYLFSFSEMDITKKSTLLFQIVFFLIIIPNFSNWLIRWDTTRKI